MNDLERNERTDRIDANVGRAGVTAGDERLMKFIGDCIQNYEN